MWLLTQKMSDPGAVSSLKSDSDLEEPRAPRRGQQESSSQCSRQIQSVWPLRGSNRDHTLLRATCLGGWSQDLSDIAKLLPSEGLLPNARKSQHQLLGKKKFLCEVDQQGNRKLGSQMSL